MLLSFSQIIYLHLISTAFYLVKIVLMRLVVLFSFFHLDTTIACQELARLKQALSTAYAAIKNNQQKVKFIVFMTSLVSSTFS